MAADIDYNNMENLKRQELQKLAKKCGIKANMKTEKLIEALKEYGKSQAQDMSQTPATKTAPKPRTPASNTKQTAPKQATPKTPVVKTPQSTKAVKPAKSTPVTANNSSAQKATPAAKTPHSAKKIITAKSSPAVKTPLSIKKTVTPKSTPVNKSVVTPKVVTPLQRTPGSKKRLSSSIKRVPGRRSFEGTPTAVANQRIAQLKGTPVMKRSPTASPSSGSGRKRKHSGDEEKQPSSKKERRGSTTPGSAKRARKTDEGVNDLKDAMKDNMTDEEMKKSLLNALDKKAASTSKTSGEFKTTQIPRFNFTGQAAKKPITPGNKDWTKIHKKHFDKMDSIDVYMKKKNATAAALTASSKKLQAMKEQMKSSLESIKKCKTPPSLKRSLQKNKFLNKKPAPTKSLFQSPAVKPFVPTITSTSKINFNFGSMPTKSRASPNVAKPSPKAVKSTPSTVKSTPSTARKSTSSVIKPSPANTKLHLLNSRKSPRLATSTPGHKENMNKSVNARKSGVSGVTPFKANTSMSNTSISKASKFDLKASLSRPVSWKPHTGKLVPFKMENPFRVDVKEVKNVKNTRDVRRNVAQNNRANRRLEANMKRRGINA